MITAMHALVYSDDATATRAFFRDVLRWPFVSDEGSSSEADEWLIFRSGAVSWACTRPEARAGRRPGTTRSLSCATTSPRPWPS